MLYSNCLMCKTYGLYQNLEMAGEWMKLVEFNDEEFKDDPPLGV